MREGQLEADGLAWLVGNLCQLHRIPFDPSLLLQQFPGPHSLQRLLEALQALGFRTGELQHGEVPPEQLATPCLGFLADGTATPALVLKSGRRKVLYVDMASRKPVAVAPEDFRARFLPGLVVARHEAAPPPDADGAEAPARFGFGWFWRELLRHRRIWRDVLLASFVIQLIALATPLGTQAIIDKVVVHQTRSTLLVIALALGMLVLFNAGLGWLRQYFIVHTGNRVDAVLGSEVLRHVLRLPLPYFQSRPTGVLIARVHAVETVREFVSGAAVTLVLDLPFLLVFVAAMFFYSWELSLIALGLLALVAALSVSVTPLLRTRLNEQFLLGARNQAFLTEYVAGMETVKSLQMEPALARRYDAMLARYLAAAFSTRQVSNGYTVAAAAIEQAMTLAVLCAGALLVMRHDGFSIGMLVAFQMFAGRVSQPLLRLAGLWQEFQQASIAVKRLGDIMDAPGEPEVLRPGRALAGPGAIEVSGLSFRYSREHPFLYRRLDLRFMAGKLTLVTGPSGCGKSTLAKLLLGFYPPDEGRIAVDGVDIRQLAANELRQCFGVVPQETVLFSGTLYENVLAANPNAGLVDVVQACRLAEIHEAIEGLPKGYETEIGEHGVGLSGGQKQRVAIARALLRRPKILLFDEATSSLDGATAERFAQTVNKLKGMATIVFIAHQLPRGLAVDEVLALGPQKASAMRLVEDERP